MKAKKKKKEGVKIKKKEERKGRKWTTRKKGGWKYLWDIYNQQYPVLQFYKENFSGGFY